MVASPSTQALSLAPCTSPDSLWDLDPHTHHIISRGEGASKGLCVGATASASPDLQHWVLDRPFTVGLDASSRVTIMPFIGQIAFNGNRYSDGECEDGRECECVGVSVSV